MPETRRVQELPTRSESPEEARLRSWFEEQHIKSVENLEAGAKQIVTLSSGLLTVLFGLMALTEAALPQHMNVGVIRVLAAFGAASLLVSLWAALLVLVPRWYQPTVNDPASLKATFEKMVVFKAGVMRVSWIVFGLAIMSLGLIVILALLLV